MQEHSVWKAIIATVEFGYIIHGIHHPTAYIGHFRPEPNFYIINSPDISSSPPVISVTLRGARGNICALRAAQIALIAGVAAWETLSWQPQPHTCLKTWVTVFRSCKMAPMKRTSLTWKEKVVILDELKLLERGTGQRSAVEELNLIGYGFFTTQLVFRGWIGPHRFSHPAAYISHFGPVRGWMIQPNSTVFIACEGLSLNISIVAMVIIKHYFDSHQKRSKTLILQSLKVGR